LSDLRELSELRQLSELKLHHICWVSHVKVHVMLHYGLGSFLYQSRVVVRVKIFVKVKVIVRVKVIPYTSDFPMSESKLYWSVTGSELDISSTS